MLKNEDVLEEFKKSLTATTKSISKNDQVEINFTKENSSIDGNLINLTEPNIESIKKTDLYCCYKHMINNDFNELINYKRLRCYLD